MLTSNACSYSIYTHFCSLLAIWRFSQSMYDCCARFFNSSRLAWLFNGGAYLPLTVSDARCTAKMEKRYRACRSFFVCLFDQMVIIQLRQSISLLWWIQIENHFIQLNVPILLITNSLYLHYYLYWCKHNNCAYFESFSKTWGQNLRRRSTSKRYLHCSELSPRLPKAIGRDLFVVFNWYDWHWVKRVTRESHSFRATRPQ